MQYLLILIITIVLLALMLLGLGLKSILRKNKAGNITTCHSPGHENSGCMCGNNEHCINTDI